MSAELMHTPEPWTAERSLDGVSILSVLADVGDSMPFFVAECTTEEDARLIAAAPDLLAAAAFALSVLRAQGLFDLSERLAAGKLEAAITKASVTEVKDGNE